MNRTFGALLIAISAACFGTLAIFGRYAYADGIDTFTLLFLRFSLAAVLVSGILLIRHESLPSGRSLGLLIGMGGVGYAGQSFSYLTAILYSSAGLVALLLYLYPVFVAILSFFFLREKLTRPKILAIGLATVGVGMTVDPQGGQWTGIFLALSAALIYSLYIIIGTGVMQSVSAVQSSTVIFASAGLIFGILTAVHHPAWPRSVSGWIAVVAIAIVATVLPVITFLAGLKRIGPTNASMLSTLEPLVTVVLAALLFGETLRSTALIGGGLILVAVMILALSEASRLGTLRE